MTSYYKTCETPLYAAAEAGHVDTVRSLVAAGASVAKVRGPSLPSERETFLPWQSVDPH